MKQILHSLTALTILLVGVCRGAEMRDIRGFGFELRIKDMTAKPSMPVLDSGRISLE